VSGVGEAPSPVAVRGTGSIGLRHLSAIQACGRRALAVPVRPARVAELAARGVESVVDMRSAVASGARLAVIATDTGRHVEDALEALAAGFRVLVEKPLSASSAELVPLVEAARGEPGRLHVAYCLRFHPGLLRFRELLPLLGAPHAVRIACQSYLPTWRPGRDFRASYSARAAEGGVLRDLSHEIDYAMWLFGEPRAVAAAIPVRSRLGIEAEEAVDVVWTTAEGAAVSVRLDYLTHRSRRAILAQGELGELEWDAVAGTVRLELADGEARTEPIVYDRGEMMRAQARAFLEQEASRRSGLCTFEEGLAVMRVCDAIREAAASGRAVTVTPSEGTP
jgi:predicted dehydrogenase